MTTRRPLGGGKGSNQYQTWGMSTIAARAAFAEAGIDPDRIESSALSVSELGAIAQEDPDVEHCAHCGLTRDDKSDHTCPSVDYLAWSNSTPPDTLREVWEEVSADTYDDHNWRRRTPDVTAFLADNPNTPPDVLRGIYERCVNGDDLDGVSHQVMWSLAEHPNTPDDVAVAGMRLDPTAWAGHSSVTEAVYQDMVQQVMDRGENPSGFLAHPTCPPAAIEMVWNNQHGDRRQALAHANCPRWIIAAGALDENPEIRAAAAKSPIIDDVTLRSLAGDPDKDVRTAAAGNPRLSDPAVLTKLAGGRSKTAKWAVAANPRCPPEVLETLAYKWLDNITDHQHSTGGWRKSPNNGEISLRKTLLRSIGANPNLSEATMNRFISDCVGLGMPRAVAIEFLNHNPSITPGVRARVVDQDLPSWVRGAYAINPQAPVEDLVVLAGDPDPSVLEAVTNNPTASHPAVVAALEANPHLERRGPGLYSSSYWRKEHLKAYGSGQERSVPSKCPRCGQFMSMENGAHVCPNGNSVAVTSLHRNDRMLLSTLEATDPLDLTRLADDPDPFVVESVALNPSTPQAVLRQIGERSQSHDLSTRGDDSGVEEDWATRLKVAVAANPQATAETLVSLIDINNDTSEQCRIQVQVSAHPNLDDDTMKLLAGSRHQSVRDEITARPGAGHLAADDAITHIRWRASGVLSTDLGSEFTATVNASAVRQAIERVGGVNGRDKVGRMVVLEARDGSLWLSRGDYTVAVTTRVDVDVLAGFGTVVLPVSELKDVLKGSGRGATEVSFEGGNLRVGKNIAQPELGAGVPVAHCGPGAPISSVTYSPEEAAAVERVAALADERMTSDQAHNRGILVETRPDGSRRWAAVSRDRGVVHTMPAGSVEPADERLIVPASGVAVSTALQGPVTMTVHQRDTFMTDGTTSILSTATPDTKGIGSPGSWSTVTAGPGSDHIPVPYGPELQTMLAETREIQEASQVFEGRKVERPNWVNYEFSQIGPQGYAVRVASSEEGFVPVAPLPVGTPDPDGPTTAFNAATLDAVLRDAAGTGTIRFRSGTRPTDFEGDDNTTYFIGPRHTNQ